MSVAQVMLPMVRFVWCCGLVVSVLVGVARGQDCRPCKEYRDANVKKVQSKLEEAFGLALKIPDCNSSANLETCEKIDKLVREAGNTLGEIFSGNATVDLKQCLVCDPAPHLIPLVNGLTALGDYLETTGYRDAAGSFPALREKINFWRRYRCPCSGPGEAPVPVVSNQEADAVEEILRKCGKSFVRKRRGLKQVFRVPDDQEGCFQSRACRGGMDYQGFSTESGYWTYDGEFWYIWEEREVGNEWVECSP